MLLAIGQGIGGTLDLLPVRGFCHLLAAHSLPQFEGSHDLTICRLTDGLADLFKFTSGLQRQFFKVISKQCCQFFNRL